MWHSHFSWYYWNPHCTLLFNIHTHFYCYNHNHTMAQFYHSPLVQVMAWCRQATSHYLNQWWSYLLIFYCMTTRSAMAGVCYLNQWWQKILMLYCFPTRDTMCGVSQGCHLSPSLPGSVMIPHTTNMPGQHLWLQWAARDWQHLHRAWWHCCQRKTNTLGMERLTQNNTKTRNSQASLIHRCREKMFY